MSFMYLFIHKNKLYNKLNKSNIISEQEDIYSNQHLSSDSHTGLVETLIFSTIKKYNVNQRENFYNFEKILNDFYLSMFLNKENKILV